MAAAVVGILRALLQADASEFQSEFDKADKTAKRTLQGIQRLANDFSGQRLVNEAAKVTIAVNQVGGASKLTQQELARVGSVVDAAVQKLRLLGQTVPPEIAKLSAEIDHLNVSARQSKELDALKTRIAGVDAAATAAGTGGLSTLTGALGMVGRFLPALSAVGAVAGLTRLATAAIESASRITDLSQKTGVSTDAIQEMEAVASQTGSSVETFAQAAFKLGVNVSEGGKKAKDAVAKLGLEYERLRALSPEQQFRTVVQALESVEGAQDRNRLGVALFGKQFSEIAASVQSGYSQMADAAVKSGADQIRALDDAGDAWDRLTTNASNFFTRIAGNAAILVEDTMAALNLGDISRFTEVQQSRIKDALGRGGEGLAQVLRDIERARKTDIQLAGEQTRANADYVASLAAARAEVAALTPAQRAQIDAAMKLSGITEELASNVGVSEAALRLYQEQARTAEQRTKELAAAKEKAAREAERFAGSVRNLTGLLVPYATAVHDVGEELHNLPSGTIHETAVETEAARKATEAWAQEWGTLPGTVRMVSAEIDAVASTSGSLMASLSDAFSRLPQVIMRAFEGGGDLGRSIGALIGDALFGENSALTQMATAWMQKIFGQQLGRMLGQLLPGVGTLVFGFLGDLFEKTFGGLFHTQAMEVNDLRDQFTSAAGGIDKLAERAAAAGLTLERFYKAKTVKDYQAAIDELNAAFDRLDARRQTAAGLFEQIMAAGQTGIPAAMKPAIDELIALGLLTDEQIAKLKKLGDGSEINVDQLKADLDSIGGRLESLGPRFQQANLDKTAAKYINSIDRMIKAGGDVGGILFDAKEEISDLVNQSIKFGTTIPENMRPWIEELARAGLLVDENGNKITDLSNLKWGDKMETEAEKTQKVWDGILQAIKDLVEEIRGPLMGAINGIPDSKRIRVTTEYDDSGAPGPGRGGDPGFATGTLGRFGDYFANFGRGFATTLHGWEAIVPKGQAVPFAMHVLDAVAARMPSVPTFDPLQATSGLTAAVASAGAPAMPGPVNLLPVFMPGQGMSAYEVGREAARYLAQGGLAIDAHGVATEFERLVKNWVRTYGGSRG